MGAADAQLTKGEQSPAVDGTAYSGPVLKRRERLLLRLKIEQTPDGLTATISKRGEDGKSTAPPAVFFVRDKEEAKRRAKAMARALGLKTYGLVDKTGKGNSPEAAASDAPREAGGAGGQTLTPPV